MKGFLCVCVCVPKTSVAGLVCRPRLRGRKRGFGLRANMGFGMRVNAVHHPNGKVGGVRTLQLRPQPRALSSDFQSHVLYSADSPPPGSRCGRVASSGTSLPNHDFSRLLRIPPNLSFRKLFCVRIPSVPTVNLSDTFKVRNSMIFPLCKKTPKKNKNKKKRYFLQKYFARHFYFIYRIIRSRIKLT